MSKIYVIVKSARHPEEENNNNMVWRGRGREFVATPQFVTHHHFLFFEKTRRLCQFVATSSLGNRIDSLQTMKFLLHRISRASLTKLVKSKTKEKKGAAAVVVERSRQGIDTHIVKNRILQWGQQCSPTCGCVIRFQATIDPMSRRYESVEYVARQVVTTSVPDGQSTSSSSMLTSRGRPMMRDCECKSLHHLASTTTQYLQGKTTSQATSMLEFQSTRSSTAFRQTALTMQGLPKSHTGCFDVMEEALTAMVKGHMVPFREQERMDMELQEEPRINVIKGRGYYNHRWTRRDEDDDEESWSYGFSKLWKDSEAQSLSSSTSALSILDLSMNIFTGKTAETEKDMSDQKALPQDWQSYVDRLYEEEDEQQSA
jgi:hypothetical protein